MADVFISYSMSTEPDKTIGEMISKKLEENEISVWIASSDILPGQEFDERIVEGIDECKILLLILSPASDRSPFVKLEIHRAIEKGKTILPFRLDKSVPSGPMQFLIGPSVYLDAFQPPPEQYLDQLIRVIRTIFIAPEVHRRIPFSYYPQPHPAEPNLTGRAKEIGALDKWLNDNENPLMLLVGKEGMGKSELCWDWSAKQKSIDGILWYSFGMHTNGKVITFPNFIRSALLTVSGGLQHSSDSLEKDINNLVAEMNKKKYLFVLDGFENQLQINSQLRYKYRTSDDRDVLNKLVHIRNCIDDRAAKFLSDRVAIGRIKSKVLITSRLKIRDLESPQTRGPLAGVDCINIDKMEREDAVAFLRAQGVNGSAEEMGWACQKYGYEPLSLRILSYEILSRRKDDGNIALARSPSVQYQTFLHRRHIQQWMDSHSPDWLNQIISRTELFVNDSNLVNGALSGILKTEHKISSLFKKEETDISPLPKSDGE